VDEADELRVSTCRIERNILNCSATTENSSEEERGDGWKRACFVKNIYIKFVERLLKLCSSLSPTSSYALAQSRLSPGKAELMRG
jgi:hypothetical protein